MASRDSRHPSRVGMPCRMGRYPVSLCDGGGRDAVSVARALRVDERGNYGRRDGGGLAVRACRRGYRVRLRDRGGSAGVRVGRSCGRDGRDLSRGGRGCRVAAYAWRWSDGVCLRDRWNRCRVGVEPSAADQQYGYCRRGRHMSMHAPRRCHHVRLANHGRGCRVSMHPRRGGDGYGLSQSG